MSHAQQLLMPMPLKAILFDVDNTLCTTSSGQGDSGVVQKPLLVEGALQCLTQLKAQGLMVVVIGDQSPTYYNHMFGNNMIDHVGERHQSPVETIQRALAAVECQPAAALLVGNPCDNSFLKPNVIGIKTVWAKVVQHDDTSRPTSFIRPNYIVFSLSTLVTLVKDLTHAAAITAQLILDSWSFIENIVTGTGALLVMRMISPSGVDVIAKVYSDPITAAREAQALEHLRAGAPVVIGVEGGLLLLEDLGEDDGRTLSSQELISLLESLNGTGPLDGARLLLADVYQPYQQRLLDNPAVAPWAKAVAIDAWSTCIQDLTPHVLCHGDLHRGNMHASAHGIKILDPRPANGSRLFDMVLYCTTQQDGDTLFADIMNEHIYDSALATAWFNWTLIHRIEDRLWHGYTDDLYRLEAIAQRRWNKPVLIPTPNQ